MLLDQAHVPHYAGGGGLTTGASNLLNSVVKLFIRKEGRTPNAQELQQLSDMAGSFSTSTNKAAPNIKRLEAETPGQNMFADSEGRLYSPAQMPNEAYITPEKAKGYNIDPFGSTPANFRAREKSYAPFQEAFESRDPFLTQAMTGRPPSGTRQKPFTQSLEDLYANKAAQEEQGIFKDVQDVRPGSYPGEFNADYTPNTQSTMSKFLSEKSEGIENAKMGDSLGILKEQFKAKFGHYPDQDELNAIIANANFAGHDYTGKGSAIFGERPMPAGGGRPSKAESEALARWREQAKMSGMSDTSVNTMPSEIAKRSPDFARQMELGPDTGFKSGGTTNPDYLRAEMTVLGYAPQKYSKR